MTEARKDYIVRRWNLCDRDKKIRLTAEYFKLRRKNIERLDWWQFLDKRL